MPFCSPYRDRTLPHSYALSGSLVFAKTRFYVKLTTFFTAKNIMFDTKMTTDSERSSEMKVRPHWTVFEILPMSAVIRI